VWVYIFFHFVNRFWFFFFVIVQLTFSEYCEKGDLMRAYVFFHFVNKFDYFAIHLPFSEYWKANKLIQCECTYSFILWTELTILPYTSHFQYCCETNKLIHVSIHFLSFCQLIWLCHSTFHALYSHYLLFCYVKTLQLLKRKIIDGHSCNNK
jgi:hypothetical protein